MVALQQALFDDGLHVAASSYIGSGPGGMIRCATFADHREDDIDLLLAALRVLLWRPDSSALRWQECIRQCSCWVLRKCSRSR